MLSILFIFSILLSACAQGSTEEAHPTEPINTLEYLPYCSDDASNLCVEGFGKEADEKLIVLFQSKKNNEISVRATDENGQETALDCYPAEGFSQNIYCIGVILPESGSKLKIDAYETGSSKLLGSGNFHIQYGQIEFAGKIPASPTPQESVSYPNSESETPPNPASYPNYPNYPNEPNYPNQ